MNKEQRQALVSISNLANDIQGLDYFHSPKEHENDTAAHRLNLAIFVAGEIKSCVNKLLEKEYK